MIQQDSITLITLLIWKTNIDPVEYKKQIQRKENAEPY